MSEMAPSLVYLFISLLVVLALAWVVIKFMASIYSQRKPGGEIQMRTSYSLGARQQLYVINFRNTDYLLGVTADRISVLDKVEAKAVSLNSKN